MSSENIIIEANNKEENYNLNDKIKEVYSIILLPCKEKIDFKKEEFKSDIIPEIIHRKAFKKEMNHVKKLFLN